MYLTGLQSPHNGNCQLNINCPVNSSIFKLDYLNAYNLLKQVLYNTTILNNLLNEKEILINQKEININYDNLLLVPINVYTSEKQDYPKQELNSNQIQVKDNSESTCKQVKNCLINRNCQTSTKLNHKLNPSLKANLEQSFKLKSHQPKSWLLDLNHNLNHNLNLLVKLLFYCLGNVFKFNFYQLICRKLFKHNVRIDCEQSSTYKSTCRLSTMEHSKLTRLMLVILILLNTTCLVRGTANKRLAEKRILDSIIGHGKYDNRIRPSGVNNTLEKDGPCNVNVNIFIRSIGKISDLDMEYSIQITFREQWNDSRLEFNSANNITYLTLTEPEKVWKPDLFFRNEKEGHFHNIIMPNVLLRIYPNGQVLYSIRISLVLSCPMNLKYYPLDKQACSIKMASYGYTTEDLVFYWKASEPVQVTKNLNLPTFSLYDVITGYCTSRTNTGEYSCIYVDLIFKREFSYYLIQIYIPNSMLVIVSWVSFWLDPNAIPARVSLGVTTLLTMATQISGINASLPPVSYTKAIDVWTGVCLTFVFGALLEFALVNYASRSDAHRVARKKEDPFTQPGRNNLMYSNNGNAGLTGFDNTFSINSNGLSTGLGPLSGFGMGNTMPYSSMGQNQMGNFMNRFSGTFNKPMKHIIAPPKMDYSEQGFLCDRNERTSGLPVIMPMNQRNNRANDLRSCEVRINSTNENFLKRWLHSFPTRSKRIDVISRIFFPTMFFMFNVVYWTTYLLRDDLKELKKN